MNKNGFTLVEILVVIAILTVMGVILSEIFFRSVRGSAQAEIISRIKQNGQAALETMDKTLRSADGLVCVSSDNSAILFVKSGVYTRYTYTAATSSVNGSLSVDYPTSGDCSAPKVSVAYLTDIGSSDPKTGVSISGTSGSSGVFVRTKQAGVKDVVMISFDIGVPLGLPTYLKQRIDPSSFQTIVELR
ncbi:MAG: prepilin-type N-terminal cleavage/methylation domain-containing protein [Candidatus Daviesbacteria bacterium]|nr:MAG: prepilin-type N-terminal cleavage/methylation domain-containing protein [Candidatus Daviesbacteria bacterium]